MFILLINARALYKNTSLLLFSKRNFNSHVSDSEAELASSFADIVTQENAASHAPNFVLRRTARHSRMRVGESCDWLYKFMHMHEAVMFRTIECALSVPYVAATRRVT